MMRLANDLRWYLAFALTSIACAMVAPPTYGAIFPAQGGAGDHAEQYRCPAGQVLVGLSGRTGLWIDQVALMCAAPLPDYSLGKRNTLAPRGGNGGAVNEQYCAQDAAIRRIDARFLAGTQGGLKTMAEAKYVLSITFECDRSRDGSFAGSVAFGGTGLNSGLYVVGPLTNACQGSEYATGLNIRYGRHLNAVGLLCGAFPSPPPQQVADRCKQGFVWREARPSDHVCVPPASRDRTRRENAQASTRVNPTGTYGPRSCMQGFVWREAFAGDFVCVAPEVRDLVKRENSLGLNRRM